MQACSLCGEANPEGSSICRTCGERLVAPAGVPTAPPAGDGPAAEECRLVLTHEASGREFVVRVGQTIGRTQKADVVLAGLPDSEYISEVHVRIERRRERWWVECLSATNQITVDGELVESGDPQAGLEDGARHAREDLVPGEGLDGGRGAGGMNGRGVQ